MTKLSVGYLVNADEADVIDIFGRLNSVSKNLNEQEKRNARFSGQMKQFCLGMAAQRVVFWREAGVFSANDISRMTEVQFMSDLVLNLLKGLTDYSAAKLNKLYEEYDESFPEWLKTETRISRVFDALLTMGIATVRDTIFARSPLLFSLFVVLDQLKKLPPPKELDTKLRDVDAIFNDSDTPIGKRGKTEAEFYQACTASTQRIKSRQIRHDFLQSKIDK
jgi:hypothetical protein